MSSFAHEAPCSHFPLYLFLLLLFCFLSPITNRKKTQKPIKHISFSHKTSPGDEIYLENENRNSTESNLGQLVTTVKSRWVRKRIKKIVYTQHHKPGILSLRSENEGKKKVHFAETISRKFTFPESGKIQVLGYRTCVLYIYKYTYTYLYKYKSRASSHFSS